MKKVLFILLAVIGLTSCGNTQNSTAKNATTSAQTDVVEVLYFHGKQRCITCNAIEKLTKEVVENDFASELKDGKIILKVIDISTQDGEKIADKYEVSWSSLIIEGDGKVTNLTDMGFSYAKGEPNLFKSELIKSINQILQ